MITGKTKLFGIFGWPVGHTFSPGMQNAAFRKLGMNASYLPFPVEPAMLHAAVKGIIPLGINGVNVTVPHKEKVVRMLDDLSQEARLIGAVNTIEVREKRLIGHNTDGRGFIRSLQENAQYDPKGQTVLMVGSGGAARAVGFSLALAGVTSLILFDVDHDKAAALALAIRKKTKITTLAITQDDLADAIAAADCLINATPLGLKRNDPLPLPKGSIMKRHIVCDLVYNPAETRLLAAAKKKGAACLPGIGMLLNQGVIAFEIWTGEKAPVAVMKKALEEQIAERA